MSIRYLVFSRRDLIVPRLKEIVRDFGMYDWILVERNSSTSLNNMHWITQKSVMKSYWFRKMGWKFGRVRKRKGLAFKKNHGGGMPNPEGRGTYERRSLASNIMGRVTMVSGTGRNRLSELLIEGHRVQRGTVRLCFDNSFSHNSPRPEDSRNPGHSLTYHTITFRGETLLVFMS